MNKHIVEAAKLPQQLRAELIKHGVKTPESYIRREGDTREEPELLTEGRKAAINGSLTDLIRGLYGLSDDHPVVCDWLSTAVGSRYNYHRTHYNTTELASRTGRIPSSGLYGIEETAAYLWWSQHPEVESVRMGKENSGATKVTLTESPTIWLDENGLLHREGGKPARISPTAEGKSYYWHGNRVDSRVFEDFKSMPASLLITDAVFNAIGGFAALAKHPEFKLVTSEGDVALYEGGGTETYYRRWAREAGRPYDGKRWAKRPKRFLLDPKGISGWVSTNVKTITGAQRSLLRLKLTQGRKRNTR